MTKCCNHAYPTIILCINTLASMVTIQNAYIRRGVNTTLIESDRYTVKTLGLL